MGGAGPEPPLSPVDASLSQPPLPHLRLRRTYRHAGGAAGGAGTGGAPASGGDEGLQNPPGFGKCQIGFRSVCTLAPKTLATSSMELGRGTPGGSESWSHQPGDRGETGAHKGGKHPSQMAEGKQGWPLGGGGPEDEPGTEAWEGHVGGRKQHVPGTCASILRLWETVR